MRRLSLLVFFSVLIVYLSFPTRNFYWDGIQFAQEIETGSGGAWFFHPNHLLYTPLGRQLWVITQALGLNLRALTVLQWFSMVTGAATAAVLFCILLETGASTYVSACLSFVFAFSATWWRFATDAASYVPSTFLVTVAFWLAVRRDRASPITIGLTLCAAMLFHQLALLFVPACALTLWLRDKNESTAVRLRRVMLLVAVAGLPTVALYAVVYANEHHVWTTTEFMQWVVAHSQDVSFSFNLPRNLWTSLLGHIRLLFGGNLRLVMAQRSPVSMVAGAGVIVAVLLLIRRFVQIPPGLFPPLRRQVRQLLPALLLWWSAYVVFLLFWLPHNTFYRLFYWPALIVLASALIPDMKTKYNRLALAAALVFLLNFGFYIYPQTRADSNPNLQVAEEMKIIWMPGDVVYWDVFNTDNRTIRYFSPQVEWVELWGRVYPSLIEMNFRDGRDVWIDRAALIAYRQQDPALEAWLLANCRMDESYEFQVGDHIVGFSKLEALARRID